MNPLKMLKNGNLNEVRVFIEKEELTPLDTEKATVLMKNAQPVRKLKATIKIR